MLTFEAMAIVETALTRGIIDQADYSNRREVIERLGGKGAYDKVAIWVTDLQALGC